MIFFSSATANKNTNTNKENSTRNTITDQKVGNNFWLQREAIWEDIWDDHAPNQPTCLHAWSYTHENICSDKTGPLGSARYETKFAENWINFNFASNADLLELLVAEIKTLTELNQNKSKFKQYVVDKLKARGQ